MKKRAPTRRRRFTRRRRVMRRPMTLSRFNPKPVFTETFSMAYIAPNTGGLMTFSIADIPQLQHYNNLYSKYRILKAAVLMIPQYGGQEQNAASYNASNSVYSHGLGRFAYAVNTTPGITAPVSEGQLLQDNGVRIKSVTARGLRMGCRPVPLIEDANGILLQTKRQWLSFQLAGPPDPKHYGISWWYTQPYLGVTPQVNNDLIVYCKLTFQVGDPR